MFGRGVKIPAILPGEVEQQLRGPNPPLILDVRTVGEFRSGHIPGAQLIPLTELKTRQGELPQDRAIITVCQSGHRSQLAARQLAKLGYDVHNMTGGMLRWGGRTVR